ncbi:MAG: CoA pyrophosphatase [Cocleimonas sp.]
MSNLDDLTENQITKRLIGETPNTFDIPKDVLKQFEEDEYRKASVLIPFVRKDDTWHIVFIRRAESEKDRHSGQVAFVGGKKEAIDDSEIDTALRETQEEIGVNPADIKILGQMSSHYSVSRFQVSPIVATFPWPYEFLIDPAEVSHTFTLPLAWLAEENNYEIRNRQPPESDRQVPVIYFNEFEGELLWGATARMVLTLIKALEQ